MRGMERPAHRKIVGRAVDEAGGIERRILGRRAHLLRPPPFAKEQHDPRHRTHRQPSSRLFDNLQRRRKLDRAFLFVWRQQHAEWDGDDRGARMDGCRSAALCSRGDRHASLLPFDTLDDRFGHDAIVEPTGQPSRDAIIAAGRSHLTLFLDVVPWTTAVCQCFRADASNVRGMEPFHELLRQRPLVSRLRSTRRSRQKIRKRFVLAVRLEVTHHRIDTRPEIVGVGEFLAPDPPAIALDGVGDDLRLFQQLDQLRRAAVNELRAELDAVRQTLVVKGEDPAADALARLDHASANAAIFEHAHRAQTSDAGANHDDIDFGGRERVYRFYHVRLELLVVQFAAAWTAMAVAFGVHVIDEATTYFLASYNPVARQIRARLRLPFPPVFTF